MKDNITKISLEEHQKDWRDSKLFKSLTILLTGAMVIGSVKLYQYAKKESDKDVREKYGWLVNYPIEFQRSVISSNVTKEIPWWAGNSEFRQYTVSVYLNEIRKIKK